MLTAIISNKLTKFNTANTKEAPLIRQYKRLMTLLASMNPFDIILVTFGRVEGSDNSNVRSNHSDIIYR
jgi:hypothetical protein